MGPRPTAHITESQNHIEGTRLENPQANFFLFTLERFAIREFGVLSEK